MASNITQERYEQLKKERTFHKFTYRGHEIDPLLALTEEEFKALVHARARRRMNRHADRRAPVLLKRLREAKKNVKAGEKPKAVKTHLRDVVITPEMVGSVVGIYNGRQFNAVEIKGEMIGHYLGEFSLTYKPVAHGRPGFGATHSSRFIPLK
ncbi:40S ribosomal protein S15, putative [Trypanosoma equiperdum]|uniref:40S ribosomal protein S15, putative n=2 Tax=Trypanozoon TaxID=39700 RepID=Q57XN7_TRYB2|nr:40S ribosomal protein S15, putative [Trypanosoma brucei brucei TREU927]XP_845860.1 40S ribosomal protein S15, putative [Trypanosoma brucei brucei TREU927]4V8M_AI Chain AI, 40S RIBOSOMAL PROTEIN S15, PUTATIVE [Trypanosoma brucei brucei TREU927]8OVA_AI Chain AI, 40S ribosomal protein S15, putative [Trypanosoma brucei brucei]8OVE_AI Chain AI, 40S ribosomal protein S15, putative [Trypanosoma brucei brucei]AAX69630.1 40S ribosomal protein S15, putative [Trypanosoma brucei]SCU64778.1 40S ribosom